MSEHGKGLLLTIGGVLALSPDTLIVRIITLNHWDLLFWRGIFSAIGISILIFVFYGRAAPAQFRNIGKAGLSIAVLFTGSTLSFIIALSYTSVANTLVIVSTSPLFAALFSWFFLAETVLRHTWITMLVITSAIVLIMSHSFQGGALFGDICALGTAMFIAGTFVITRRVKTQNMIPAMALSGVLTTLVATPLVTSIAVDSNTMLLLLLLGLILTVAFALLTLGPRYIPAPEVSLILPLETVLGTVLVWVFIGEQPSVAAMIGGVIVIAALTVHSIIALRVHRE